ncbi:hypothetical protein AeMF1_004769 [Aphanomyces euteiches]|nr:hypothetical protein AeMF1_004769 [Aphanomyces euteiches]KAH9186688.1 hypothetical protein AeNC1_011338 [Aphanomyces euteiches]
MRPSTGPYTLTKLRALFCMAFILSVSFTWHLSREQPTKARLRLAVMKKPNDAVFQRNRARRAQFRVSNTLPLSSYVAATTTGAAGDTSDVFFARIIGNALPPRHDPNRTLTSLKFILEREFQDPRVKKHWVLNRILDPHVEKQLMDLLNLYNASFSRIPFVIEEYAQAHLDLFDQDNGLDHIHSNATLDQWNTNLLLSSIYDAKNLYAMSINHARNAMIELGISKGAKWILPWDENCFLTLEAWRSISQDLDEANPAQKYFVVWMDRLKQENHVVFTPNYRPNAWEEPQIIFRRDAVDRFDEALRYGRRDKAALLIRHGVPGVWFDWGWSKWERSRTFEQPSEDVSHPIASTGYVVRLFSGKAMYEDQAYGFHREMARADAVAIMLNTLETRVMKETLHYDPKQLLIYNTTLVNQLPRHRDTKLGRLILYNAERALNSSTVNNALGAFLAAVKNDHHSGHKLRKKLKHRFDSMVYNVTALVLGWIMSKNDMFKQQALLLLHFWFVNENTAVIPIPGLETSMENNLAVTQSLPVLLDVLKLLEANSNELYTFGVLHHIKSWLQKFYDAIGRTFRGKLPWFRTPSDPATGLLYDLQMASLAAYLDHPEVFRYLSDTVQSRLLTRHTSDVIPNSRIWLQMATIAKSAGIDIWAFHDEVLCRRFVSYIPCCDGPSCDASSLKTIYTNGWDMLPILRLHCPLIESSFMCSSQISSVVAVMDEVPETTTKMMKQHHVAPYPELWRF